MTTETDRAVLVAQALGWHQIGKPLSNGKRCWAKAGEGTHGWDWPKLDVSLLPAIWADCEARGWRWERWDDGSIRIYPNSAAIRTIGASKNSDFVLAMVDAWLKARGM